MSDLQKLGHKLLRERHPDLEARFSEIDYLFGKLVLTSRIKKGLTQGQLASMCDFPLKTIHRVEGGNGDITVNTYKTIFEKLEIPTNEIVQYLTYQLDKKNGGR